MRARWLREAEGETSAIDEEALAYEAAAFAGDCCIVFLALLAPMLAPMLVPMLAPTVTTADPVK